MKYVITTFFFYLLCCNLLAQNLGGIWVGKISRKTDTTFAVEKFELHLKQRSREIEGYSFAYGNASHYVLSEIWGKFAKRQKDVVLQEDGYVFFSLPPDFEPCQKKMELKYFKLENTQYLIGGWSGGINDSTTCWSGHDLYLALQKVSNKRVERGTFVREKIKSYIQQEEPEWSKKEIDYYALQNMRVGQNLKEDTFALQTNGMEEVALDMSGKMVELPRHDGIKKESTVQLFVDSNNLKNGDSLIKISPLNRPIEIQQVIQIKDEYFKIHLYDNGYVDGDIVSIFANKLPIALNQKISDQPLTYTLKKPASKLPIELLLQAENLGEIPPNTGIMIIEANSQRYELRINSSFEKHAVIMITFAD